MRALPRFILKMMIERDHGRIKANEVELQPNFLLLHHSNMYVFFVSSFLGFCSTNCAGRNGFSRTQDEFSGTEQSKKKGEDF